MDDFDSFLDALKERYSFAEWPRGNDRRRDAFPRLGGDWQFERRGAFDGSARKYTDFYERGGGEVRIAVTIDGHDTAADAHDALIRFLSLSMVVRLPSCEQSGFRAGDVCFCGGGNEPDKVFFVRDSTFVRVENVGSRRVPVGGLAETIDRQLM